MDDLALREHCEGDVSVLTVRGELDMCSGPQLDDCLIDLAALGRSRIVLDVVGLRFCDAAGIRILLRGEARARARGGWLRLAGADSRLRRVLAIVGLTGVLPVFGSVADATAGTGALSVPGARVMQTSGSRVAGEYERDQRDRYADQADDVQRVVEGEHEAVADRRRRRAELGGAGRDVATAP